MKSVTNVKRSPFHANRNGHDEGLRSSSSTRSDRGSGDGAVGAGPVADDPAYSAWRIPDGQRSCATSAPGRGPRPKTTSAGATGGDAADVSARWVRLPARI